jgi:AmmeMemoRadiSam system protein B
VSGTGLAVRPPAVSGIFYDADPHRLARTVDRLLDRVDVETGSAATCPVALVAPHAGLDYSGPVAATAYAQLGAHAGSVDRVVLLGPSHFAPVLGMAVPAAAGFATPLGTAAVDVPACLQLAASCPGVAVSDGPHAEEHSLEVQLPFLQRVLGAELTVVPVLAGGASPDEVADALEALGLTADGGSGADGDRRAVRTLLAVSTDLSHYLDASAAARRDRATADAVVRRDPGAIGSRDACGDVPLRGLLTWARRHGLEVSLLDLRSSADTAGGRARVVGYGAFRVDRVGDQPDDDLRIS